MAARPHTLEPDAWSRHPVSVTEALPRQVTLHGPVLVHANLSDEPSRHQGSALAVFGEAAFHDGGFTLAPDSVAIVAAEDAASDA